MLAPSFLALSLTIPSPIPHLRHQNDGGEDQSNGIGGRHGHIADNQAIGEPASDTCCEENVHPKADGGGVTRSDHLDRLRNKRDRCEDGSCPTDPFHT